MGKSSLLEHHALRFAVARVNTGPLDGEEGSLEELLVGVLFANILAREALLGELLGKKIMSGDELLFCVARVENECLALKKTTELVM